MNSKEPQKYILIEPTTLEDIQAWATDEAVERPLFKPFDENATQKQLRDALEPEICYWQDTSDDTTEYWGEELLDSVVEKALTVLGLLGGTTNGK